MIEKIDLQTGGGFNRLIVFTSVRANKNDSTIRN